jgi:hypothetical protein
VLRAIICLFFHLTRVSPAPDVHSIHIPDPATDERVSNTSRSVSSENLDEHRLSTSVNRRDTRVSIDPESAGTLSFHGLSYEVGGRSKNGRCKNLYAPCIPSKTGKQIIDDVSGIFSTGLNAILGKYILLTRLFDDERY